MSFGFWLNSCFFLWLFRNVRLIANCISHWTFRPVPLPENPTYTSQDVTIILPTIAQGGDELETTLKTCLKTEPFELILVTIDANVDHLTKLANRINAKKIRVLSIRQANKRRQMCRAIPEVQTKITVFVDDDVLWPAKILQWMLAPFEDPRTGGVGTSQRLRRPKTMSGWSFLGAAYLERRNFDCSACLHIDGGLPCLSGRTVAYRSCILQEDAFTHGFTNETWRTCQLNADDDNFITRWLYAHDWKIRMQYHKEAEVQTTLEDGPKYLSQCMRWIRSNWRSNFTSLLIERHYWWTQPWSTYSVLQTTFTAWSILWDGAIIWTAWLASYGMSPAHARALSIFLFIWIFLISKTVKLWGHYARYPEDIRFIPLYIGFGYFHCLMKAYGLLTLHETTWGSRDGADTDDGIRMMKLPPYGAAPPTDSHDGRKSATFEYAQEVQTADQLPAYETYRKHQTIPLLTTQCND
jgi:hypothetical protein